MGNKDYEQKKRECWKEFIGTDGIPTERLRACLDFAFERAYALGKQESKQESKQETVIQGWVAVDDDGDLFLYRTKPARDEVSGMWLSHECPLDVGINLFPDLSWDDDPQEVEIVIKRKKNG